MFINGIAWEVPRGPIDVRSMFGYDAMLVHSSGELLPVNEHGFLMKGLLLGESYFLVCPIINSFKKKFKSFILFFT